MAVRQATPREIRYLSGTTFNTTYTAADNAAWNIGTATKLRPTAFDASGLKYSAAESPELHNRVLAKSAVIPTIREGELKFSTYLEGGSSDTTANPVATLMSKCTGGLTSPVTNKTDLCEASCTTTQLEITGVGAMITPGQAVLVGVRGDAGGGGQVSGISAEDTNDINLTMALAGAPSAGAAVVYSHTVFIDPTATQNYVDLLALGVGATPVDQVQTIGCSGTFGLNGLNPGEVPMVDFSFMCGDWQWVASDDRTSSGTTAGQGNLPAMNLGIGALYMQDAGATTRATWKVSNVTVNPNITYEPVPQPDGINGKGGWCMVGAPPTIEFDILIEEDMPGLYDDFLAGTDKMIMIQLGHVAQKCIAIEAPRFTLDEDPRPVDMGALRGVHIVGHCDEDVMTNVTYTSPLRIHFF